MWTLKKEFKFEASHQLKNHDGKCRRLHGHSWVGEVEVYSNSLNKGGSKENMVMDYGDLKKLLEPLIDTLDHYHLNDVLLTDMPTSEFLCKYIYDHLKQYFPFGIAKLKSVTIKETCTSEAKYEEI